MTNKKICIVGLGYVGLPLAIEFAKYFDVIGYDISADRVRILNQHRDPNEEVEASELRETNAVWTAEPRDIQGSDVFIVTVPTPVDANNQPDLTCLEEASRLVGHFLGKGGLVVYESTVFPGCTEEVCKPVLENVSGLKHGSDFYLGYSPERINPADKVNTISKITKVVSGCCEESTNIVESLYDRVIDAGTFRASSIQVAEAAKITENIQRDVNIALMNELSTVFNKLDIDTFEVIKAASSKWNFIPFRPGLVGGHCIGVDPYYLISRAADVGLETPLISSSRMVNELVVDRVFKLVQELSVDRNPNVLLMGLTFKEDCPDLRNSKSIVLAEKIAAISNLHVIDPYVEEQISELYEIVNDLSGAPYDCVIISVKHRHFSCIQPEFMKGLLTENGKILDLLNLFPSIKDYSL